MNADDFCPAYQAMDHADAKPTPSTTRPQVCLIVAADKSGLFSCDGSIPWQFKASGQIKRVADDVANGTVVVGHRAAIALGGKPPGRRAIVLTSRHPRHQLPHAHRKEAAEHRAERSWQGCEIAHSVNEVFARCTTTTLYVVGGRATFELFLPFASAILCHVLQETIFDNGVPPSVTSLYFPPLPSKATLADIGSVVVQCLLETRREVWRVETQTVPPTRAEAVARIGRVDRPGTTTSIDNVTTTDVILFCATADGPENVGCAPRRTCKAPERASTPSTKIKDDDSALKEALAVSLAELTVKSEMLAMQERYAIRASEQDVAVDHDAFRSHSNDDDDDLLYASDIDSEHTDDLEGTSDSDENEGTGDNHSDTEGMDTATESLDDYQLVAWDEDGQHDLSQERTTIDCMDHALVLNTRADVMTTKEEGADNGAGHGVGVTALAERLGRCPIAHLLDYFAPVALAVVQWLTYADRARLLLASRASLCAMAELGILGVDAKPVNQAMSGTLARMVALAMIRVRSTYHTLDCIIACKTTWCRRRVSKRGSFVIEDVESQVHGRGVGVCSRTFKRIRAVKKRGSNDSAWPCDTALPYDDWSLCQLWPIMELATRDGRHDVADKCLAILDAMGKRVRAYADLMWHMDTNDQIALDMCRSIGVNPSNSLRSTLSQSTWTPPLRVAQLAGRNCSAHLATMALSIAQRHTTEGIHITRDGHRVLSFLSLGICDPCAYAAAAANVVATLLAAFADNCKTSTTTFVASDINRVADIFGVVEHALRNTILPAVNQCSDVGPSSPAVARDPVYKAALDHACSALCARLVSLVRMRDHGIGSLTRASSSILKSIVHHAAYLLGIVVGDDVNRNRTLSAHNVRLWPMIGQYLCEGDAKDGALCALMAASLPRRQQQPQSTADADHRSAASTSSAPVKCDCISTKHGVDGQNSDLCNAVEDEHQDLINADDPTQTCLLVEFMIDCDPDLVALVFSHLSAADMGSLAFASRRAFLAVSRMVLPPDGSGRRPIVPGICDWATVASASSLYDPVLKIDLFDPMCDMHGDETAVDILRAIAVVGCACRRLPRLERALLDLHNAVADLCQRSKDPTEARSWVSAKAFLLVDQKRQTDTYERIVEAFADLIARAVDIRLGSVIDKSIAKLWWMSAHIAPWFARSASLLHFARGEHSQADPNAAVGHTWITRHRRLRVAWSWCPTLALVRIAARQRSTKLLRIAYQVGRGSIAGRPDNNFLLAILATLIDQLERTLRAPDHITARFLNSLAKSVPRRCLSAAGLAFKMGVPGAPITSLSLRFFLLCAAQGTVSRHCAAMVSSLAWLAL